MSWRLVFREIIMARMLATFLLLLSLGTIMFNHANGQDSDDLDHQARQLITDCSSLESDEDLSGIYIINPQSFPKPVPYFTVFCNVNPNDVKGWTVIQRRYDGSVDFFRGWDDYVNGFGKLDEEFWLGLEQVHQLTSYGSWHLKVLLEDWDGSTADATYDSFRIGDEVSNYSLTVGGYSGTAGDSIKVGRNINGMAFSTKDRDNDLWSSGNCAESCKGAWWYEGCAQSNLNGLYLGESNDYTGMAWYQWKGSWYSYKSSTMMIRPA